MSADPIRAIQSALPRRQGHPQRPGDGVGENAGAAADAAAPSTVSHIRQTVSNRSRAVTTTVTTTITTIESALSYEPTVARYSLSSSAPEPLAAGNEVRDCASAATPAPFSLNGNGAQFDRLIDDLVQYFHAVEAERLSRFLAKARGVRSAPSSKGLQAAQAYASHV